jgi:hypothetical protein
MKTKEIIIPESLEEIKLSKLIEYLLFSENSENTEIETIYESFRIFLDLSKEDLDHIKYNDIEYMYNKLVNVFNKENKLRKRFHLNGIEYGMIPNLDSMSMAEYVDLDTFITPLYEGEVKNIDAYKFLAVLYRPIKKMTGSKDNDLYMIDDYDFRDEKQNWELFRDCPSDIYIESVRFFFYLRQELLNNMKVYLKDQIQILKKIQQEKSSVKDGDGMDQYICFLEETLQLKTKLLECPFVSVLLNSNSLKKIMK